METRMEMMRPGALEEAQARCPTLLQPLGTIEWHGRQNVVGVDAVKAHALCMRAAEKAGCVVAPPVFGGIGGLTEPFTFVMEADDGYYSSLLRGWLERLCSEAKRNGFKAVILLTGHYGAGQQILVREVAVRMSRLLDMPILGTPEYFLALDVGYVGDHAAFFETSLMMHLCPETVDLGELRDLKEGESHQGVHGRDPKKYATKQDGERLAAPIIARLAVLATEMPRWDRPTLERFIAAEEALVNRQMMLAGQSGKVWSAWRHIVTDGPFSQYPQLLASGQFDEIVRVVNKL